MLLRCLLAAMLAATLATAQRPIGGMGGDETSTMGGRPARGGQNSAGNDRGAGGMTRRPSRAEQIADRLKLNKDQKADLQTVLSAAREEALPVMQELLKGRNLMAQAMVAGKSQEAIDPLLKTYVALSAELSAIETRAFAKLCARLKPNQLARAGQAFDLMASMFEQPDMGRGRGGR
ncbi:MAG: hypothetical protein LAP87_30500 [Acidobacteriia bacterium]|nr:hypothetical protein [Terriglobia bacterium]